MSINERINKIMEAEGLTVASFARKTGIADQTVRSVCILQRNKPSFEFLSKVVQTFEWINPIWLLTGEGEMKEHPISTEIGGDTPQYSCPHDLGKLIDYLKEKDMRIEQLLVESTTWRIKYENLTSPPPRR